jgi:CheY-like chemotaxis protein
MVNDKRTSAVFAASSESAPRNSSSAILVVEDDEDSREMLVELIRSLGYASIAVASADQLFEIVSNDSWHIALVDLQLPEVDGYEIVRRLRNNPATRDKKLIALTGYSDEIARATASHAGFDGFLVKPILPEQLIRLLEPASTWTHT